MNVLNEKSIHVLDEKMNQTVWLTFNKTLNVWEVTFILKILKKRKNIRCNH